jgi:hypothetical protein
VTRRCTIAIALLFVLGAVGVYAQRRGWRGGYGESFVPEGVRTAREIPSHSTETPTWTNPPGFEGDVFTFARIQYTHNQRGRRGGWSTDVPDADLNLSYRLQQLTSVRTDPDGRIVKPTDPDLGSFPFLYIVEPGSLSFSPEEALALRNHLLNGGFVMLDDFWGEADWDNAEECFREVFPDRTWVELPLDHELYQRPFAIKSKGQVPNYGLGTSSQYDGITWETPNPEETHHRAILDDQKRIMVLATHNTDNGDGWEREGENSYFFEHFSEKISYPLGINIVFYIMTH